MNRTVIDATPERVFEVLSDPDSYGYWVVGSSRIRDADADFPAPGSRFHHTQGIGGIGIRDATRVVAADPPRRLVLTVCARPLAVAEVTLDLASVTDGTEVSFRERPLGGFAGRLPRLVVDPPTRLRNEISLRRLRKLAEANGRS
jgi:uncharacterized protein YndB with AHSA1/START domain